MLTNVAVPIVTLQTVLNWRGLSLTSQFLSCRGIAFATAIPRLNSVCLGVKYFSNAHISLIFIIVLFFYLFYCFFRYHHSLFVFLSFFDVLFMIHIISFNIIKFLISVFPTLSIFIIISPISSSFYPFLISFCKFINFHLFYAFILPSSSFLRSLLIETFKILGCFSGLDTASVFELSLNRTKNHGYINTVLYNIFLWLGCAT